MHLFPNKDGDQNCCLKDILFCPFGHLYGMTGWAEEEVNGGGGRIAETGVVVARTTEDAFL